MTPDMTLHSAAEHAKNTLLRLSSDGGLLDQIASGQWDERIRDSGREAVLVELLTAIGERARVDRIVLDALVPLPS